MALFSTVISLERYVYFGKSGRQEFYRSSAIKTSEDDFKTSQQEQSEAHQVIWKSIGFQGCY